MCRFTPHDPSRTVKRNYEAFIDGHLIMTHYPALASKSSQWGIQYYQSDIRGPFKIVTAT